MGREAVIYFLSVELSYFHNETDADFYIWGGIWAEDQP